MSFSQACGHDEPPLRPYRTLLVVKAESKGNLAHVRQRETIDNELNSRRQPHVLTPQEEIRLMRAIPATSYLRPLVVLLLETGLRVNKEALQLKWTDIDFEFDGVGAVHIRQSKLWLALSSLIAVLQVRIGAVAQSFWARIFSLRVSQLAQYFDISEKCTRYVEESD